MKKLLLTDITSAQNKQREKKVDLNIERNDVALLNKVNRKIGMIFDERT